MLFDERVGDIRHEAEWEAIVFPLTSEWDASNATAVDYDERDFSPSPPESARYGVTDAPINKKAFFKSAEKSLEEFLFHEETLNLFRNKELKVYSRPGESEDDFSKRCLAVAEDRADEVAEKLRDKYEDKAKTAERRLAQAERRVRELEVDVGQRKQQEVIAGAGQVLSMFLGGRKRVSGLSGMASRRSQTRRTQERFQSALEKVEDVQDAIAELEEELTEEIQDIWEHWQEAASEVESYEVPLERTDVALEELILFWAPRG
jgi:Mg2+ and Co2+ transporter CorA